MHRLILLIFLSVYCVFLRAQTDTLLELPQAEIKSARLRQQPAGAAPAIFDSACLSLHRTENLAEMLSKKSGVYIKSYGLGSLATSAVRGSSAGQTAVVWNGFPLQSPMVGQLDFSLLPVVFTDEISLQYGGNSAAWGSGAIGGAVILDNITQFYNGLSAKVNIASGSFGWQNYSAAFRYGNGKLAGSTRLFFEKAENDFSFKIHPDLPEKKQEHATLQQQGILQEIFWNLKPGQELGLRVWLQSTGREIPPTLVQTRSAATQADEFLRTSLHWKRTGKNLVLQARTAFFAEKTDYRDELIGLESLSKFHSWMGEAEASWLWGQQFRLQSALLQAFTRADAPEYENPPEQSRTALFAAFRREGSRWRIQLDGRIEAVDGSLSPITPGLGLEGDVRRFLKLKAKIARNYRLPTFNDLYWEPGGNSGLLPESGWSEDLGWIFHGKSGRWDWEFTVTGFNRRIRNWILWARREGQSFFSPQNIAEVWSRGVENRFNLHLKLPFAELAVSGGYDFTRSTNEKAIKSPKIEAGAQLFYVPRHQVFGEVSIRKNGFQAVVFHRFTGAVTGLNEAVPYFSISSFRAQYAHFRGRWSGTLFLHIENLWNADYKVIERRPMPGRYFRAGISTGFIKNRHHIPSQ